MEFLISILLTGISAAAVAIFIERRRERKKVWAAGGIEFVRETDSLIVNFFLPACRRFKAKLGRFCTARGREKIKRMICDAGLETVLDADTVCSMRVIATAALPIFSVIVLPLGKLMSLLAGIILGWNIVTIWLSAKKKRRREEIEIMLPGALDWLALSVEAGMDFAQAIGRVAERLKHGALKAELMRLDSEIKMGTPRRDALSKLAQRSAAPALSRVLVIMAQADALGVGMGGVLKAGAKKLRFMRFARAEKKGALAAQLVLFPLAFCIMPVTFIVVFGPIAARLASGGLGALF